ncbi:MAG: hypothetical protein E7588_00915 [Ruminococcaceae bacterium]|nr:hypothetical protein [Oscillospiraceae bacterium]
MKVYGHRGAAAVAPENTLACFEIACKMGCHAVECDVHFTSDKKLVIMHTDYEVGKMWGKEVHLEATSLEELKSLRLTTEHKSFENEIIPTLQELYELMKKYPEVDMNVELKTQNEEFYDMVVKTTAQYRMNDRVIYSASDPHTLKWFGKYHPDIPFSLSPVTVEDTDYARGFQYNCNCVVVQPYFKVVDADYVKNAHAAHLQVTPWTVDDPEEVKRLISIGVDGIISNNPGMVLDIIKNN